MGCGYASWWGMSAYEHTFTFSNLGRIHTGSGSVPDSGEPYASGRLSVGFAFTLQTTDPTRTVRVHFAVYTLRLLRDRYLTHDICHLSGLCELYQWK